VGGKVEFTSFTDIHNVTVGNLSIIVDILKKKDASVDPGMLIT
jgi:hypothetical protein